MAAALKIRRVSGFNFICIFTILYCDALSSGQNSKANALSRLNYTCERKTICFSEYIHFLSLLFALIVKYYNLKRVCYSHDNIKSRIKLQWNFNIHSI